ncbi:MAG: Sjogren's syndrome/scleroderma autoantigen 1 family protein [Promethearchaeota archaeon]
MIRSKEGIKINENIKKMADLLRSGNTMLNMACPICSNPIFRNSKGLTFCPTCNREIIIVNDKDKIVHEKIKREKKTNNNGKQIELNQNKYIELLNSLENIIYQKIKMISTKLEDETHLQVIEQSTKILSNFFDILDRIADLKNKK